MGKRGPQSVGRICDLDDCSLPHHSQGLCRKHYLRAHRKQQSTGGLALAPIVKDDGVRGPADLPIPYKTSNRNERGWTVILAYPSFDGTQPCRGNEDLFEPPEGSNSLPHDQSIMARSLCAQCKYLVQCREWGVAHEEFGFFGGLDYRDRRQLRAARGQVLVSPQVAWHEGFTDRNHDLILDRLATGETDDPEEDSEDEWGVAI